VDEAKLKILRGKQVFIWSAIDLERYYDVLGLKVSASRGELDAILFLKEILHNTAEKK
jgi:transposase-like protein